MGTPDFTCIDGCLVPVCANGVAAANAVINCAVMALIDGSCMGFDPTCLLSTCSTEVATCFALGCKEM
jgi:hypothetical protein